MRIDARLHLLLVAVLLLSGAQRQRLVDPIPWEPVEVYEADDPSAIVTATPLEVGAPAPEAGWLLHGKSYPRIGAAYLDLMSAYKTMERGRRLDRWTCDEVHAATIEGLRVCRQAHPRTFAAGAAVGFGSCAGIGWAVEGARP